MLRVCDDLGSVQSGHAGELLAENSNMWCRGKAKKKNWKQQKLQHIFTKSKQSDSQKKLAASMMYVIMSHIVHISTFIISILFLFTYFVLILN